MGLIGCFSFYPGKNLGAYGEGGAVTTNDDDIATRIRQMRDWGQIGKSNHVVTGFNYRMDGIQGAILGIKLLYLREWTEARKRLAKLYSDALLSSQFGTPEELPERCHVYHIYAISTTKREAVMNLLTEREIQHGVHYPVPVHLQPVHEDLGYSVGDLPLSEKAANEVLSLPMFPEMTEHQQDEVLSALADANVNL